MTAAYSVTASVEIIVLVILAVNQVLIRTGRCLIVIFVTRK